MSCARPVISDLHFGQTLDGRPDLEKRGKIANFLTENLERESKSTNFLTENFEKDSKSIKFLTENLEKRSKSVNFLNLNKPASSAKKMSIATLEDLPGWNHFFQTNLDTMLGKTDLGKELDND